MAIISQLNLETNMSALSVSIIMDNNRLTEMFVELGATTIYTGSNM